MKRPEFWRAVGLLSGSAAIAHGITAAALPLLSRLYSPVDFSALAVFASLASVLSAVAALRYDIAVPLPEDDHDALNLLALSIVLAASFAVLLALVALGGSRWIAQGLNQPRLERWLWLLPIAVFTAATSSALQSWFTRRQSFGVLARSRIWQSSLSAGTQAGLGYTGVVPGGLLAGYVTNTGIACIALGGRLWREEGAAIRRSVNGLAMRAQALRYERFPRYATFDAIFNNGSVHLPIVLIAAYATGPEAGYVALAMTLLQAPMSLVGAALGQVYLSRAPEAHRRGALAETTSEMLTYLLRVGVGPLLAAGIAAPALFEPIFGAGWQRAGSLVSWMTPWFVLQFLAVPVGMALHITGHQREAMALQFTGLVVRVGSVLVAAHWIGGYVAEAYAISGAALYVLYLYVVARITGVSGRDGRRLLTTALPHLAAWVGLGVLVALGARWMTGS